MPEVLLPEVWVRDKLPEKWVARMRAFNRLRYNVYKTYPYALEAAKVLADYETNMEALPTNKARRKYKHETEAALKARFKGELTDLTISQGQVLVKLINRQTGRDCYDIIKDVKGGFNAVIFQGVALMFNNSLKREYDPTGADKDMEQIVRELEASKYYRYQYQTQHIQSKIPR